MLCSRNEVGTRTRYTAGKIGLYPLIYNHDRHSAMQITKCQQSAIEDIAKGLADITGDTPKFLRKYSRFGELDGQPLRDRALHARNLMSLLVARYEMENGKIIENLRRIETKSRSKKTHQLDK